MFWFYWPWGMRGLTSPRRDGTHTPCIGRQSLNHWTTREVPPAPSEEAMVFFTLKSGVTLHERYHPTWVRCSGLCYGNKQPLSQSDLSPPKCISHPHSMTHLGSRGLYQGAITKLHHLVTAPNGMCVLGPSLPHSALDRTHSTSTPASLHNSFHSPT